MFLIITFISNQLPIV